MRRLIKNTPRVASEGPQPLPLHSYLPVFPAGRVGHYAKRNGFLTGLRDRELVKQEARAVVQIRPSDGCHLNDLPYCGLFLPRKQNASAPGPAWAPMTGPMAWIMISISGSFSFSLF